MNQYGQYCPIARALEILGDRWTLLILRDMLCGERRFNELERGLPGISRALLAERLRRLQRAGVVERQASSQRGKVSYRLTAAGQELQPLFDALTRWGADWAFGDPRPDELNPVLLLWWMRDRVFFDRLPGRRVVIEFVFREARPPSYWLVLEPADASVCITHPGFEIDMLVTAELAAFLQVWLGRLSFSDAVRQGRVELDAPPSLAGDFPNWFALSPIAPAVRQAALRDSP
jgi:DNA-binding HxlR family transcriptional regulator